MKNKMFRPPKDSGVRTSNDGNVRSSVESLEREVIVINTGKRKAMPTGSNKVWTEARV